MTNAGLRDLDSNTGGQSLGEPTSHPGRPGPALPDSHPHMSRSEYGRHSTCSLVPWLDPGALAHGGTQARPRTHRPPGAHSTQPRKAAVRTPELPPNSS